MHKKIWGHIWFLCDAIILTSLALIGIAFAEERKTFKIDVICPENDCQDVIRYCATFTVEWRYFQPHQRLSGGRWAVTFSFNNSRRFLPRRCYEYAGIWKGCKI